MDYAALSSTSSEQSSPEQRGRGRARGRGRRSRGRGRGRIQGNIHPDPKKIQENLSVKIDALPEAKLRELFKTAAKRQPSLILDVMEGDKVPEGGYHPSPSSTSPTWCVCTNCREMPTQQERVCCGYNAENCITQLQDFELLILNEAVLELARAYQQDVLAVDREEDWNRGHRHAAYRQYILWQHGRLGAGIRRIIPSCCVWAIRDRYPDRFGQYVGFQATRI